MSGVEMADITLAESSGAVVINVSGRLTIQDALALKSHLLKARQGSEKFLLDLSKTESMDLACMQVLCAAAMTFNKGRKLFGIKGGIPEGIEHALKAAALGARMCGSNGEHGCIWETGGEDG